VNTKTEQIAKLVGTEWVWLYFLLIESGDTHSTAIETIRAEKLMALMTRKGGN
jgi:hypothetical protein